MSAGILTWQSYGALLARLLPNLQRTLFAGADGSILWCSDPASVGALQPTLAILVHTGTNRHTDPDKPGRGAAILAECILQPRCLFQQMPRPADQGLALVGQA